MLASFLVGMFFAAPVADAGAIDGFIFGAQQSYPDVGLYPAGLAVGDRDGDGDEDVVIASYSAAPVPEWQHVVGLLNEPSGFVEAGR